LRNALTDRDIPIMENIAKRPSIYVEMVRKVALVSTRNIGWDAHTECFVSYMPIIAQACNTKNHLVSQFLEMAHLRMYM
jgi:hypothetical protein